MQKERIPAVVEDQNVLALRREEELLRVASLLEPLGQRRRRGVPDGGERSANSD